MCLSPSLSPRCEKAESLQIICKISFPKSLDECRNDISWPPYVNSVGKARKQNQLRLGVGCARERRVWAGDLINVGSERSRDRPGH